MRKVLAAVVTAALTMQFAAPVLAQDFFPRTTLLGWRQQTGVTAVAYFRAPIGPSVFKSNMRSGFALTGPRSYAAGDVAMFSQGPRLVDFSFAKTRTDLTWAPSLSIGPAVAWTNAPDRLPSDKLNLMESGLSWVAVGALTAGLAIGLFAVINEDEDAAPAE